MMILRTLVRLPLRVGRLLLKIARKSVKLTLGAAAVGALLIVLDALLLDSGDGRPDAS